MVYPRLPTQIADPLNLKDIFRDAIPYLIQLDCFFIIQISKEGPLARQSLIGLDLRGRSAPVDSDTDSELFIRHTTNSTK